jgi:hypothetical protein
VNQNFEYSVATSFLGHEEVSALNEEFNKAFNDADSNKISANIVEIERSEIKSSKILSGILGKIMVYFTDTLGVSGVSLAKVWMVKSQPKDTDPKKLPYLPHFDKHRYLKSMIYLHDVDERNGPIHFGDLRSPPQIDVRRKDLPANYKELGCNIIGASELKAGMNPIIGKKGDGVFFDTNAAHCAGIVSEGFERHVIRFDFEVHGFNPKKSFFQRLVSAISSRFS